MSSESPSMDPALEEFRIEDEAILDLSPSSKFVYTMLFYHGPITQSDLVERTGMPPRTVRHALTRLQQATDRVEKRPYPSDARQDLYTVEDRDS